MDDQAKQSALPVGTMIEEFRITRVLGAGAFGVVYQCDNTYLDETVAIKEFLPVELATRRPDGSIAPLSAATEKGFNWALQRFLQEAKTLWSLGRPVPHRNIVRVTRYRELNGSAYLFMDFERGLPLSELLKEDGRLPYDEVISLLAPLLDGLERVHSLGVVHRDIKPANILIRADGSPVLIDFGAARMVTRGGERSVFATFTPLYAALEQHQDICEQGPWTDIYGLGATLYRTVTGKVPQSASSRLLNDPQPPASKVAANSYPPEFLAAIDWACELDPRKRPQSVAEWRTRLFADLPATTAGLEPPTVLVSNRGGATGLSGTGVRTGVRSGNGTPITTRADAGPAEPAGLAARTAAALARAESSGRPGRRGGRGLALALVALLLLGTLAGGGWYLWPWLMGERPSSGLDITLPATTPGRATAASEYERQALTRFAAGELPQAIEQVDLGLAVAPDDARLRVLKRHFESQLYVGKLLERARASAAEGDLERSLGLVEEGLAQLPTHPGLTALRAEVAARLAEREQAAAAARERAVAEQRVLVARTLSEVEALVGAGDLAAAVKRLDAALALVPEDARLTTRRAELAEASAALAEDERIRRRQRPDMVPVAAGCFQMGSPAAETNREPDERAHEACVGAFAISRGEVTVEQFERFVTATGYQTDAERGVGGPLGCWALDREVPGDTGGWDFHPWASWRSPNKYQATHPDDPVSCVSYNDALAYTAWLGRETGRTYRLPTEAEWEYAARAGTTTARFWGNDTGALACKHASVADTAHGWRDGFQCDDGHEWVAPVGVFTANPWGLHDLLGNVSEWTCSEYDEGYGGGEKTCAAAGSDVPRVLRGGGWNAGPAGVRAAYRDRNFPEARYNFVGFRVVAEPAGADAEPAKDPDSEPADPATPPRRGELPALGGLGTAPQSTVTQ